MRIFNVLITLPMIIEALYWILPAILGFCFSFAELARKYPTVHKYACTCWAGILYMLFSSVSTVIITYFMRVIGAKVINNEILNCILLSILCSGMFIGIISNIKWKGSTGIGVKNELITIRDYIISFLDSVISRKLLQKIEHEIKIIDNEMNRRSLAKESKRLIRGVNISEKDKKDILAKYDILEYGKDYSGIIRLLIQHYELDYIIDELKLNGEKSKKTTEPFIRTKSKKSDESIQSTASQGGAQV